MPRKMSSSIVATADFRKSKRENTATPLPYVFHISSVSPSNNCQQLMKYASLFCRANAWLLFRARSSSRSYFLSPHEARTYSSEGSASLGSVSLKRSVRRKYSSSFAKRSLNLWKSMKRQINASGAGSVQAGCWMMGILCPILEQFRDRARFRAWSQNQQSCACSILREGWEAIHAPRLSYNCS